MEDVPAKVRSPKLATPLIALIVLVPPSVPPVGATVLDVDAEVTTLLPLSRTETDGKVESSAPAVSPTG